MNGVNFTPEMARGYISELQAQNRLLSDRCAEMSAHLADLQSKLPIMTQTAANLTEQLREKDSVAKIDDKEELTPTS